MQLAIASHLHQAPCRASALRLQHELGWAAQRAAPSAARLRLQRWGELLLSQVAPRRCPVCDHALTHSERTGFCPRCVPPPQLRFRWLGDLQVAGGRFEGGLRRSIHQLKYMARPEVATSLADWLYRSSLLIHTEGNEAPTPGLGSHPREAQRPPWLVAVPLHRDRLVERGYNQAGLLASALGSRLKLRVNHRCLVRVRATAAQARLGALERAQNISGAFQAGTRLRGERVILVDDVATTGSTLRACAAALREVGTQCAGALVVAIADEHHAPQDQ